VKFSLFFEMQIAEPTPETEAQLFHQCVEQAVLAEALGYHAVWAVEHHGLYEYSHSSAPELFLAFVAARTSRIRLGHGVTLLPHRYNHPIRIAERIAALDILSNGRVNWGSGKSSSRVEQEAFETDVETLHEEWLEALRMIPKMWASDVFEHHGRFFNIPPTAIVPRPVQRPCPPMFVACTRPETATYAGSLGLGALNFAIGTDEYLTDKVRAYRQAIASPQPVGPRITNHFACTPATLVLADDRQACRYGLRGARFFHDSLYHYYKDGGARSAASRTQEAAARPAVGRGADADADAAPQPGGFPALSLRGRRARAAEEAPRLRPLPIPRGFLGDDELNAHVRARNTSETPLATIVGDPSSARETVQRFVDVGVDELILVMQMGTVPHELVIESIRTFGEHVLPHF
jgi:alkanesulfonate monooxygenase SsuD/methylene tetrahydromethanopterin reductase-like flavin-dependent oxidoreductase (luciferase family)